MNYHNINIQQIEYFLAVAKHLNFTEASHSLYISQPTLSKQIALFEEEINAQLFIRNKRKVSLTPAGELLNSKLGGILQELDSVLNQATQVGSGYDMLLDIGCLDALDTSDFLVRSTELFKEKYPNVQISFERASFKNLRNKMINNEFDLTFTLSFEVEGLQDDLEYREIWETSSSIITTDKHPLAKKNDLTLADFKEDAFVVLSRDETPNGFDGIIAICRQHGFTPKITKFVSNIESLILCVETGIGVALVDTNIALNSKSKIVKHQVDNDFIKVVAVWRKDNKNPALKLYQEMLL